MPGMMIPPAPVTVSAHPWVCCLISPLSDHFQLRSSCQEVAMRLTQGQGRFSDLVDQVSRQYRDLSNQQKRMEQNVITLTESVLLPSFFLTSPPPHPQRHLVWGFPST